VSHEENTRVPTRNNIPVQASKILPTTFPFHGANISLRCVGDVLSETNCGCLTGLTVRNFHTFLKPFNSVVYQTSANS
jgi:hypothetical protein